jgi:hypothetical protein
VAVLCDDCAGLEFDDRERDALPVYRSRGDAFEQPAWLDRGKLVEHAAHAAAAYRL